MTAGPTLTAVLKEPQTSVHGCPFWLLMSSRSSSVRGARWRGGWRGGASGKIKNDLKILCKLSENAPVETSSAIQYVIIVDTVEQKQQHYI
jgi:hypothetical protein